MTENLLGPGFRERMLSVSSAGREMNAVSIQARQKLEADIEQGKIQVEQVTICPCGSDRLEPLFSVDRFGLKFGSLICVDCGLVLTNPRISEAFLPYYYDTIYHPLNYGTESLDDLSHLFADGQGRKIFRITHEFADKSREMHVLEIGCGTGSVLREFIDEAKEFAFPPILAFGTEYSQQCLEICSSRNDNRNIQYVYGGLKEVRDSHSDGFDLIILSHVFEHFTDLGGALSEIKDLMKPEGLLYIEVPGIFQTHKAAHYGFSLHGYLIHAHMYNFTANSLANIVCATGYQVKYLNENVEAVFDLSRPQEKSLSERGSLKENTYENILFYLKLLDRDREHFLAQVVRENELQQQVKALLLDIRSRDQAIAKKDREIQQLTSQVQEFMNLFIARAARKVSRKLTAWFEGLQK